MLTTQFNAFLFLVLMLFFWHNNLKKTFQANWEVLDSLCVPWVRQKVLWLSTHCHDTGLGMLPLKKKITVECALLFRAIIAMWQANILCHTAYFPTNNSERSDPTVVDHRTWVENGFSQQAIVIVRLISGFHHWITSFLAIPVCKSADNARKVRNNAFLMLFFQNRHLMPNLMPALCVTP